MLIHPDTSLLLIVDVQEKLAPAVHNSNELLENNRWLLEVAQLMEVPVLASEQYPRGLGHTVEPLKKLLSDDQIMEKTAFSCMAEPSCNEKINALRPNQVIITGIESHICVLQTAIQLRQQARQVFVVEDCISSRRPEDKALALERLRANGVHIVSREMVVFEWLQKAGGEKFKTISKQYLR